MQAISVGTTVGVFINEVFRGEDIGLEKIEDNFYHYTSAGFRLVNSMSAICGFAQDVVPERQCCPTPEEDL
jgi:hypothetical protein